MNTSDTTRFLRWGLPGWIAILCFSSFVVGDVVGTPPGASHLFKSLADIMAIAEKSSAITPAVAGLLIAAAGFPLGFVTYQLYFFLRWNSPFSRDGLLPPLIVGRIDDLARTQRDITNDELAGRETWRQNLVNHPAFREDHGFRWRYIEALMGEAAQKLDSRYHGADVNERHHYLLDIMHVLGASTAGAYLGFLSYVLLKGYLESLSIVSHLVFLSVILGVFLFFLEKEDAFKRDRQSPERLNGKTELRAAVYTFRPTFIPPRFAPVEINYPAFLLIAVFAMWLLFIDPALTSPNITPESDGFWRLVIILLGMAGWVVATRSGAQRIGIGLWLGIGLLAAVVLRWQRDSLLSWVDWSFMIPFFMFLVLNLALLKNRQNARDDLIALQYYTLRRFWTEQAEVPLGGSDTKLQTPNSL